MVIKVRLNYLYIKLNKLLFTNLWVYNVNVINSITMLIIIKLTVFDIDSETQNLELSIDREHFLQNMW